MNLISPDTDLLVLQRSGVARFLVQRSSLIDQFLRIGQLESTGIRVMRARKNGDMQITNPIKSEDKIEMNAREGAAVVKIYDFVITALLFTASPISE
jgi:hypothetical protein